MPKQSPKSETSPQSKTVTTWLTVTYQPVSLFSLKRSDATSMAARSNLVPTPYAIKMALLKVLLESQGRHHPNDFEQWIKTEFTWIRDLIIYICPPERLVVNRNALKQEDGSWKKQKVAAQTVDEVILMGNPQVTDDQGKRI